MLSYYRVYVYSVMLLIVSFCTHKSKAVYYLETKTYGKELLVEKKHLKNQIGNTLIHISHLDSYQDKFSQYLENIKNNIITESKRLNLTIYRESKNYTVITNNPYLDDKQHNQGVVNILVPIALDAQGEDEYYKNYHFLSFDKDNQLYSGYGSLYPYSTISIILNLMKERHVNKYLTLLIINNSESLQEKIDHFSKHFQREFRTFITDTIYPTSKLKQGHIVFEIAVRQPLWLKDVSTVENKDNTTVHLKIIDSKGDLLSREFILNQASYNLKYPILHQYSINIKRLLTFLKGMMDENVKENQVQLTEQKYIFDHLLPFFINTSSQWKMNQSELERVQIIKINTSVKYLRILVQGNINKYIDKNIIENGIKDFLKKKMALSSEDNMMNNLRLNIINYQAALEFDNMNNKILMQIPSIFENIFHQQCNLQTLFYDDITLAQYFKESIPVGIFDSSLYNIWRKYQFVNEIKMLRDFLLFQKLFYHS